MSRRLVQAVTAATLFLVTATSAAAGEGWVLWQEQTAFTPQGERIGTMWVIGTAYTTASECKAQIVPPWRTTKRDRILFPGEVIPPPAAREYAVDVRMACFPANGPDPRGPKN